MRVWTTTFILTILTICVHGQVKQDTVHYFTELFPENGLFRRPDSLPDGVWIAYCETNKNQIGLQIHYKNGERNGSSISFWPDGKIHQKGHYKDGCLVGMNETWYKNGVKESESICEADDYEKNFFHCNKINYWQKDGTQLIKDGTGKYFSHHGNDTLQVVGEYKNSLRTGKWTWYYDNGAIQYIEHFNQDKQDGEYIFYYRNGKVRNQGLYSNGKQVGKWESWYEDGQNKESESRVGGKRDGEYRQWHPNGQLSTQGNYKLGKEDGIWKAWDETGKLESEEEYKEGKSVKSKNYR